MAHRTRIAVWVALAAIALAAGIAEMGHAAPTLQFSHLESVDPEDVSEGWTRNGFASPGTLDAGTADVEIGPLNLDPNCRGCGLDAWGVDDRSGAVGAWLLYEQTPAQNQVEDALALGWTLRVRLRVASESDVRTALWDSWFDSSIFVEYGEGAFGNQRRYRLNFGATSRGYPIVGFPNPITSFTSDGDIGLYVLYELIYRPLVGDATLFVDGVERLSNYIGVATEGTAERVQWGSDPTVGEWPFEGDGTGRGHFQLVEWEIGLPVCFDEVDNDGDGFVDLADPSCLGNPTNATESLSTECDDGLDNDSDGEIDLADPACANDASNVAEETACDDDIDNDADGQIDLADPTCAGDASNIAEVTACDDGADNDSDGRVDLADAGCLAQIARDDESGEIVVNTTLDKVDGNTADGLCETDVTGECSLRAAIIQTNWTPGLEGVQVPGGMFELTIPPPISTLVPTAADGDLDIDDDVVLIGAGAEVTQIGGDTDLFSDSIFHISPGANVTFHDVTIQNGRDYFYGGGIYAAQNSTVKLTNSTVTGSGSIYGGGIDNRGTLTLTNSTVSGNFADFGAGIVNWGPDVTLVSSTVSANISEYGAGGGILNWIGTLTLTDSTVSDNDNYGLINVQGDMTVTNSTVSGNPLGIGGGDGTLTVTNTTVSGNTFMGIGSGRTLILTNSTVSGGIRGVSTGRYGTSYLKNSIVVGSIYLNCDSDGTFVSLGNNISDDDTCSLTAVGDLPNTDAELGLLADNGGPTLTHLPMPDSPVIDAADNTACPATDQRGVARPIDGDDPPDGFADCDIGAVEFVPEPHGSLMLVAGAALLALLYRRRTRGLRLG